MRAIFVTQEVDPASPVLGATVAKIRALAACVDEVAVLADRAVDGALPANCAVHLFRSGTRFGRGLRFESALARELARGPRRAFVLAHMCPIYAVLAAPVARPLGCRVLLWFTHWRASRLLAAAERLSNAVVTVEERTFPLPVAQGGGDRPRDRPRGLPVRGALRAASRCGSWPWAGRLRPRGSRRSSAGRRRGAVRHVSTSWGRR